jgi:hypothetical protein
MSNKLNIKNALSYFLPIAGKQLRRWLFSASILRLIYSALMP